MYLLFKNYISLTQIYHFWESMTLCAWLFRHRL